MSDAAHGVTRVRTDGVGDGAAGRLMATVVVNAGGCVAVDAARAAPLAGARRR